MWLLFEIGVHIGLIIENRRNKKAQVEEEAT
jgi:Sec-independent protein secretion pathway component TatC